jgi:uncharacterized protein (DUF2235 family)
MPKNIVLCSDGTGATAMKNRGTNVFKLYEAVDLHGHVHDEEHGGHEQLAQQIAFYDDGVGSERHKLLKIAGGAFGWGLSRNVKQLYAELVRAYEPGDQIYLFGFSRGAFTVRTLAGLIVDRGILDRQKMKNDDELRQMVEIAYEQYRRNYSKRAVLTRLAVLRAGEQQLDEFRETFCVSPDRHVMAAKPIRFLGVWDTVDAVGLPSDKLAGLINRFVYRFTFPDRNLSPQIQRACHALAVDDQRKTFHPVMWDEDGTASDRLKQVWFSGMHSNVGGGYTRHGMSLVSLDWMMTQAERAGLRFVDSLREAYHFRQNVNDKMHDSRRGLAVGYRYLPRDIAKICMQSNHRPRLHMSVFERIIQGTQGYAPGNLPLGEDVELVASEDYRQAVAPNAQRAAVYRVVRCSEPLLTKVWWLVGWRHHAQLAFLFCAIVAVAVAVWPEFQRDGWAAAGRLISSEAFSLAKNLLSISGLIVVGLVLFFYLFGLWVRRRMERHFSRFWHTQLPELRGETTASKQPERPA